ncbi:hypothetical protein, partial [Fulvivirga aurantia]|uniref:hypothetical protein n=1 Tax=Fulvivirga aurantia TaxID=2529383 RepID=UPI001624D2A0
LGGATLLVAGIIDTANTAKDNEDLPPSERDVSFSPLMFAGAAVVVIPLFTKGAKRQKMYKALEVYNQ